MFQQVTKEIAQRGQEAQLPGVSKEGAQQHFAIVLDGQVITAPSIDYTKYPEGIDASQGSQISGGFTLTSAENLADELQSGALPIKLNLISQSQVSATLGKQALSQGLLAGLLGFAVVCLFLLIFYRVLGVIAIGGLVIYAIYYFALIKLIPITLTLPGIAGLILTIGIAADANIVIFERVKEEIRGGRSIVSGIATGYKRGFAAIVDANVVTFMTAFILFALATAEVKGFAFTLGHRHAIDAVHRGARHAGGARRDEPLAVGLPSGRARRGAARQRLDVRLHGRVEVVLLAVGHDPAGRRAGDRRQGAELRDRLQVGNADPDGVHQVRQREPDPRSDEGQRLRQRGDPEIHSKSVGGTGFQISTETLRPEKVTKIESALDTKFGNGVSENGTKDFSSTSIGPTFGKTIAKSAVIAIIASLLVISAYIALRFEWKYAVPVLIALMHDLLITAGVYSLTGREVTTATVAALLTILGYSLYDTIIVFDRVRENVPRMPRAAFSQIVNRSMSEVLTRSLATSFCTLLPVLALLLFGGETLKNFAFALMIGIASGAYSSIFIASPVLTEWKEREGAYRGRRARIVRELGAVPAYATALGWRAGRHRARAGSQTQTARQHHGAREAGRADLQGRVPGTGA